MWQTLLNSATFGHNVAVGPAGLAAKEWQRRIDWLTVTVLAIPAGVLAVPLELVARRSGAAARPRSSSSCSRRTCRELRPHRGI